MEQLINFNLEIIKKIEKDNSRYGVLFLSEFDLGYTKALKHQNVRILEKMNSKWE